MTGITPKQDYVFTFAKDEDGADLKFRFILTLGKKLTSGDIPGKDSVGHRLMKVLATLDGIENFQTNVGFYSVEVGIARTFDADEVIAELKKQLESDVLSEIIKPKLSIVSS